MNEKSIKLIAEDVAAKINKINRFGTQITGYHVIERRLMKKSCFSMKGCACQMCDICRRNPCSRHCPNNTEKPLNVCDSCGCDIYAGEHYYEISFEGYQTFNICEDCMDSFGKYAES